MKVLYEDGRPWRVRLCRWPGTPERKGGWSVWRMLSLRHDPLTFHLTLDFQHPKEDVHRDLLGFEVDAEPLDPAFSRCSVVSIRLIYDPFGVNEHGRLHWFMSQLGVNQDDLDEDRFSKPTWKRAIASIRDSVPVPGILEPSTEQIEIFRLLGEQIPYLWDDDPFLSWVRGQEDGPQDNPI